MSEQQIRIFTSSDGRATMEVALDQETVWLSQAQMAELFGIKRPAITKHLSNVYKSGELDEESTCSIMEHVAESAVVPFCFCGISAVIKHCWRGRWKN